MGPIKYILLNCRYYLFIIITRLFWYTQTWQQTSLSSSVLFTSLTTLHYFMFI